MLLYFHTSPLPIYLFILLNILLFSYLSTAGEVRYFINCGSSMTITDDNTGETFFGDHKNDTFDISGHGKMHTIQGVLSGSLYQTARVFKKAASYDFHLPQIGTYFVRLHICTTSPELVDANFSVSASGHMLLPDFNSGTNSNCSSSKPWEFILSISNANEKLRIYFEPNLASVAFVNAIEVLSTTSNFSKDKYAYVTPAGRRGDYKNMNSSALETIYRINVGGQEVEALSDDLRRTWIPDDLFLTNKGDAENAPEKSSSVDYSQVQKTDDYAPQTVYGTAKRLNSTLNLSFLPNLTWQFNVSRGTKYFVRAHFCDIVSPSLADYSFNFYINGNFSEVLDSNDIMGNGIPFFKDYVADSGDLAYLNISIGPNNGKNDRKYLFLNGLEIMQMRNESAHEPHINGSHNIAVLVGSVASAVAVIGIVATLLVCLRLKKRRKKPTEAFEWGNLPLYDATSSHHRERSSSHASTFQNLQLGLKIPFVEIQRVTNNFDADLIIGEGGFGKVYKGTLRNGLKVAVKRGSPDHGQGIEEFQTEIMILSKIRHRHLVSLIGYCYENGEMILVYEFMEKGTLRYHLYDSEKSSTSSTKEVLSWKQRLQICIGAAKGIQYLHRSTSNGIIHRDIKPTNILLDENFVAKVADFGISRSGHLDQLQVSITDVKGTCGYLDPEYAMSCQVTEKSDVYAFGMVLLEVLCARPVILRDQSLPKEQLNLKDWAMVCYKENQIEKIIDPLIASEINPKSLEKFFETAERCVRDEATDRPTMSDVTWGLEYALQLQRSATEAVPPEDTMTDASLNMPLPAVQRILSQSITDGEYYGNTETGEVFSQLTFDDRFGIGR